MGWLTDLSNVAVGAIERDRQITKEDLLIRAENLNANRDLLIKQKDYKYKKDLDNYDKELEKFKAIEEINALKASGSIDDRTYATRYLTATMPGFTSLAPNLQETEVENFKGKTASYTLQGNIDEINKNAALESTMINDLTAEAIKDAKGNSFLINKILNKKQEVESDILKDIESKLEATKFVELTEKKVDPANVGIPINVGSGSAKSAFGFGWTKKKWKDYSSIYEKRLFAFNEKNASDKNNMMFTVSVIEGLPGFGNAINKKEYIKYLKDGQLESIKGPGKNFFNNMESSMLRYADYLSDSKMWELTEGNSNLISKWLSYNQAKKHMRKRADKLTVGVNDGGIIGEGGSFNLIGTEKNFIAYVPWQIVDFAKDDNTYTLFNTNINLDDNEIELVKKAYANTLLDFNQIEVGDRSTPDLDGAVRLQNKLWNTKYGPGNLNEEQAAIWVNVLFNKKYGLMNDADFKAKYEAEAKGTSQTETDTSDTKPSEGEKKPIVLNKVETIPVGPRKTQSIIYLKTNEQPNGAETDITTLDDANKALKYATDNKMTDAITAIENHIESLKAVELKKGTTYEDMQKSTEEMNKEMLSWFDTEANKERLAKQIEENKGVYTPIKNTKVAKKIR